jgi:hypothetical protein
MPRPIRNSILGRNRKPSISAGLMYPPPSVSTEPTSPPQTAAPAAQRSPGTRFPAGYRSPPLTLVSTYPEKSPYGLPPVVLLAAIRAEIGRNPSLAPSAPKAGKFIWNPLTKAFAFGTDPSGVVTATRQHERQSA